MYREQGKHYHGTRDLSIAKIAGLIRRDLRNAFPGKAWKWAVTSKTYSGGQSITVTLVKAPYVIVEPQSDAYSNMEWQLTTRAKESQAKARAIVDAYNYEDKAGEDLYGGVRFYRFVEFGTLGDKQWASRGEPDFRVRTLGHKLVERRQEPSYLHVQEGKTLRKHVGGKKRHGRRRAHWSYMVHGTSHLREYDTKAEAIRHGKNLGKRDKGQVYVEKVWTDSIGVHNQYKPGCKVVWERPSRWGDERWSLASGKKRHASLGKQVDELKKLLK